MEGGRERGRMKESKCGHLLVSAGEQEEVQHRVAISFLSFIFLSTASESRKRGRDLTIEIY